MQLYFIRHGQSANNALWDNTGSSNGRSFDPALTDLGLRQAELVGQFLKQGSPDLKAYSNGTQGLAGFGITHLYCSLMLRAVGTAEKIAEALDLPFHAWTDLHEEGGLYLDDAQTGAQVGQAGTTRAEFQQRYPRLILPGSIGEGGWWDRPFEQVEDRLPRAQRFLHELLERHGRTEDRVAMVSHGGFYNWFLVAVLNLPVPMRSWFVMYNTAITRVDFHDQETRVVYMNRLEFLPRHMVT